MSAPSIAQPENLQTISWQNLQVGKLLGQGGYSEVYHGQWNGKEVAIKQLLLKKLPEDLVKDFQNETKIMAQVAKCAQIVKLLGACLEEGHYAMVMEYMDKGSLYQILRDVKIDLPWNPLRFKVAIDIGKGLSYLHDREILHRDLKSPNILLDAQFNAKITDFGLSKIKLETKSTSTVHKQSAGTVRWKAPELFKFNPVHTKASDIYSFGMILWEIDSRKIPYGEADDSTIISGVKDGEREEIPTETPSEYSKLITRAWSKEPDKRPSSHYIVLELEKLLPKPQAKSWQFDPETKVLGEGLGKEFALINATAKDVDKVMRFYAHHPVPGYETASVKVVYNPTFNRSFESHMKKLQKRHGNSFFDPKWSMNLLDKQSEWREKVAEMFENMAKPFTDPDYPNVKLLPLWHGTYGKAVESICQVGYANPTATDAGFFGRGLYGALEAEYPYRVYCKGAFFLNWVAIYSVYPVVIGDESKLESKGNFENYDAHFIPVSPRNPSNPLEQNYDPCKPFAKHTYTEVVVFESAACLPRYLVELEPTLTKAIQPAPIVQPKPASRPLPAPLAPSPMQPVSPPLKPSQPALASPTVLVPSSPQLGPAKASPLLLDSPSIAAVIQPMATVNPIPFMVFGKVAWEQYIGDVGVEPPLPPDIDKILGSPCPFWPGKKVRDTHLLTLIPKTVNGKPLTLISLEGLVKAPKQGNPTQYREFNGYVKKEHGDTPIPSSYWVLMTRDVIEGSRDKVYDEQCQLVASKAKSTGLPYTLPKAIEATASILMHYVRTKEYLYTDDKTGKQWTYTRCQEKVDHGKFPVAIGGFALAGLRVSSRSWARDIDGVGCVRKFS